MSKIYIVGDGITDQYWSCNNLGKANEADTPLLRQRKPSKKQGGISFVRNCIRHLISPNDEQGGWNVIEDIGTSLWNITRYQVRGETYLTVENECYRWKPEDYEEFINYKPTEDDIVVFWDDNKSDPYLLECFYQEAACQGSTIVVDSSREDVFQAYPKAQYFKLSYSEIIETIPERPRGCHLIVTARDGAQHIYDKEAAACVDNYYVQTVKNPVDTIGAGDVFLARLVYGLWKHEELPDIIPEANRLARESIGFPGCYFPKEKM